MDLAQHLKIELINKSVAQEEAHIYFNALLDIAEQAQNDAVIQEIIEQARARVREQTARLRAILV